MVDSRTYHGDVSAAEFANALVARFNHGTMYAQKTIHGKQITVQIATHHQARSGGQTALGVTFAQEGDSIVVKLGKQAMWGIAASLGNTALRTLANPWNIVGRLDDLAVDIQHLDLDDQVWRVLDEFAQAKGASHELAERLRSLGCEYCRVANPVGEPSCIACGAPLGDVQPSTCKHCGQLVTPLEQTCPNCNRKL